jgi:hypothetical protein
MQLRSIILQVSGLASSLQLYGLSTNAANTDPCVVHVVGQPSLIILRRVVLVHYLGKVLYVDPMGYYYVSHFLWVFPVVLPQ